MELLRTLSAQAAFINAEVIPWVLRLVMIGLGLSLTLADFKRVLVFPKAATIGLSSSGCRLRRSYSRSFSTRRPRSPSGS
jgi:hypothetical protein